MKRVSLFFVRLVVPVGLVALAATANAQGGLRFCNDCLPSPPDRRVLDVNCDPLVGTNYVAQLYYGSGPDSLVADTAAPSRFRAAGTPPAGTWVGAVKTLVSVAPGTILYLQVRVWDLDAAPTYDQATENMTGAQYGKSGIFTHVMRATPCEPPDPVDCDLMLNFRGFKLVTNPPPNILVIRENGERVDLMFKGTHTIEGATNITGPWVPLTTASGPYTDPDSATLARRFYRMRDEPGPTYSQNAVGYYRLNLCQEFSLIADQLLTPGGNTLTNVFKVVPNNTQVYKYIPATSTFRYMVYVTGLGWFGNHPDLTLNPGEGIFLYSDAPLTHRFFGDVSLASSIPIPHGWSLLSAALPQEGPMNLLPPNGHGFPIQNGDQIYQWKCANQLYEPNEYVDGLGWSGGSPPVLQVGEAFFLFRAEKPGTWTRTFSVGP